MTRAAVGLLGGLAATLAFVVGAVSLTRIAGDYLGFPPYLEWTFTGAVDVAGIAGGVMWTAFTGPVRAIGKPMNIVCTVVSGVGVGLDHATHAGRALRDGATSIALPGTEYVWPIAAFIAGVFMPALATWILHALSVIADNRQHAQSGTAAARTGRQEDRQETRVVIASSPAGDRQRPATPAPVATARTASTTASTASTAIASTARPPALATPQTASPDRQQHRQVSAAARPAASQASVRVGFPGPRPDWMSDTLLAAVLDSVRKARHAEKPKDREYGRPRMRSEHGHRMADGKMTDHQARTIQAFVDKHDLLRVSA